MSKKQPDFSRYLATSVDDLKSTLGCEVKYLPPGETYFDRIEFFTSMAAACTEKTKRSVIETHIRKLEKLSRSEPHKAAAEKDCAGPKPGASTAGGGAAAVGSGKLSKGTKALTLATLSELPPAFVAGESEDQVMGRQLTQQWERVKASRKEDLIFGAMMCKLREHIATGSARGATKASHDPTKKGTGLKGWLETYAPTVSESIAYRLMEIAEGIAADFHLKRIDLEALLGAQIENLDTNLAKKRAQIEEVIEGKSQRQLLLEFGRAGDARSKNPGGFRPNALILRAWLEENYPKHPEYLEIDVFTELPPEVQKRFKAEGKRYEERLTNEQRAELEEAAAAREWNAAAPAQLHQWQDALYYHRADDTQLAALEEALADFLQGVRGHIASRKKPASKKLVA